MQMTIVSFENNSGFVFIKVTVQPIFIDALQSLIFLSMHLWNLFTCCSWPDANDHRFFWNNLGFVFMKDLLQPIFVVCFAKFYLYFDGPLKLFHVVVDLMQMGQIVHSHALIQTFNLLSPLTNWIFVCTLFSIQSTAMDRDIILQVTAPLLLSWLWHRIWPTQDLTNTGFDQRKILPIHRIGPRQDLTTYGLTNIGFDQQTNKITAWVSWN